jgi:7-cyano-7-deazaguanine synthase
MDQKFALSKSENKQPTAYWHYGESGGCRSLNVIKPESNRRTVIFADNSACLMGSLLNSSQPVARPSILALITKLMPAPTKHQALVLLSGGMDSVTALYLAAKEHQVVGAVSFDYGAKHNTREIPLATWHCQKLGIPHDIIDLSLMDQHFSSDLLKSGGDIPDGHYAEENMKRTVVPFRNGIMLAAACGLAESRAATALVIAAHSGDHAIYPDCREPFMQGMAQAMREGTYAQVELLRPFIQMDKTAIALAGSALGVDYGKTWSCYKGGALHCGSCGTCVERREAFIKAGLNDPTVYLEESPLPSAPEAR